MSGSPIECPVITSDQDLNDYQPPEWEPETLPPDSRERFRKADWAGIVRSKILHPVRHQYQYKNLKDDEIRLLMLSKKRDDGKIFCTVHIKPLKDIRKRYAALSYHWGTEEGERPRNYIYISDARSDFSDIVLQTMGKSSNEPKPFGVHDNLFAALHHLQSKERTMLFWVDAICINQRETEEGRREKKIQVSRMAEIYNSASNVCIWLGPGEPQTDTAMDFIKELVVLDKFDQLIRDHESVPRWEAFTDLMKTHWFSRRWVVQEVALSRHATLHCGKKTVNWNDFQDAVSLFMTKLDQIKTLFKDPNTLLDVEALGAIVLVNSISNLSRKSEYGDIQELLVGLETLVTSLLPFDSSKPHDTIYSLLSLARDTPEQFNAERNAALEEESTFTMEVEYQKPAIEVFIDFTKRCIQTSKSLDIICRYWAPEIDQIQFPSWIPKIKDSAFGDAQDGLQGRRNADSLVGSPLRVTRKTYNASRGSAATDATVQFGQLQRWSSNFLGVGRETDRTTNPPPTDQQANSSLPRLSQRDLYTLNVKGFQLATIVGKSGRILGGIIDHDWLRHGGWNPKKRATVPDKLWRTLVADRGPDGGNPPGWYRRACSQCLNNVAITDVNGDFNVSYVQVSTRKPTSDVMMQFLKRVRSVVWNRAFFVAKSFCGNCRLHGHSFSECSRPSLSRNPSVAGVPPVDISDIEAASDAFDGDLPHEESDIVYGSDYLYGLAPGNSRVKDTICILSGCTVPVVLRPHSTPEGDPYYELVGEAFVYGKMDGEAMAGLKQATIETRLNQWFTLR